MYVIYSHSARKRHGPHIYDEISDAHITCISIVFPGSFSVTYDRDFTNFVASNFIFKNEHKERTFSLKFPIL